MRVTTRARFEAAIVAIAPTVLLAAFVYHPHIRFIPDAAAVASAAASDPTRWGLAHIAVGVGSGLGVLAFLAVQSFLRTVDEPYESVWALPFIVMGSTLFTLLPGMEFAALTAAKTGADVRAAQAALAPWFVPILFAGSVTFAVGVLGFAKAITRSGVLKPGLTLLVVGALGVMAAARFVPLGIVQFYVGGAAGIAALWPLAYTMWKHMEARPAGANAAAAGNLVAAAVRGGNR